MKRKISGVAVLCLVSVLSAVARNRAAENYQYAPWMGTAAGDSEYTKGRTCGGLRTYPQRYAAVQH